jgi:hypothetical protein
VPFQSKISNQSASSNGAAEDGSRTTETKTA